MRSKLFNISFLVITLLTACNSTKYVPNNKYLLDQVHIKSDLKNGKEVDLIGYLRQTPNTKMFEAINFNLGLYNLSGKDTTLWINRFLKNIGNPPVIYDSTLVTLSEKEFKKYMTNKGYENAEIKSSVTFKKKKARVQYEIISNEPYKIENISYKIDNDTIRGLLFADTTNAIIKKNNLFDIDQLERERIRIAENLRNHGYFLFNKEYVTYLADSSKLNHQIDLTIYIRKMQKTGPKNTVLRVSHERYKIQSVKYLLVNDVLDISNGNVAKMDTITYKDKLFIYNNLFVNPSILDSKTYISANNYYSEKDAEKTYSNINAMHVAKFLRIDFVEVKNENDSIKKLECIILISPNKNQSFSLELEGTNSDGDFGVAGKFGYTHRNVFKGAENFTSKLKASNEAIGSIGNILTYSSWEISGETGLQFPRFIFPFLNMETLREINATTEFNVNYSYQIRPDYSRTIAGFGIKYRWKPNFNKNVRHSVDLLDFSYVYLPPGSISSEFKEKYLNSSSLLQYSYEDHLILKTGYYFSYSNQTVQRKESGYSLRAGIETAGNSLYGICSLLETPKQDGAYMLGKIKFSQYVKIDGEYSFNYFIDESNRIVYHVAIGIGAPYGNSDILPFEKRYYGGGANSVRGWSVRTLGPGSYNNNGVVDYMSQSGDMKLDLNIEYRAKLFWVMELGVFADGGNVWTLLPYGDQKGGNFQFDTAYKQIALGYGMGLRFDFSYFILRLDWGIKAYDPSKTGSNAWRFNNTWNINDDTALHFAVGYPF